MSPATTSHHTCCRYKWENYLLLPHFRNGTDPVNNGWSSDKVVREDPLVLSLSNHIYGNCFSKLLVYWNCRRFAVVTGANKGIGLGICRQLAASGVTVVLTARDRKRGFEALQTFEGSSGFSNVVFHQLDVVDPDSIASLADFVKSQFGRLDILVRLKPWFLHFYFLFFEMRILG